MLEKDLERLPATSSARPAHRRAKQTLLALAACALAGFHACRFFHARVTVSTIQTPGVWWSTCPDEPSTYCGFLNVPLDYSDPQADETVSLALRMIPATVPPKEQLGYLLTNPGGPGGSGTGALLDYGKILARIVNGRYNIVSWDPRAVNLTSPGLGCFETVGDANRFLRDVEHAGLSFDARGSPALGFSHNASLAAELAWTSKIDAFGRAIDYACRENANKAVMRSSSTAFTARDMKSIMEALGEETLKYWGFSYGTILGATFSAMFPELVGRVVLDGVPDAEAYTQNLFDWGRAGMVDTRKVLEGFFSSCATSGPLGCAFAREKNSTAEALEARYDALLERLREEPLPVGTSAVGPGVLSASDVQYTVFHALYQPRHWPHMAQMLADTERSNGSEMFAVANVGASALSRKPFARKHSPFHRATGSMLASTAAIMCGDTDPAPLQNSTTRGLWEFMRELRETTRSPTADIWTIWMMQCRHWGTQAIEAYRGPWSVKDGLKKTNFPIVFLSLTADPVTPLSAARKMQAGFGNDSATLVVQDGFGHCSLAQPSLCTAKTIRSYFLDGVVPSYNTRCASDEGFIFPHPGNDTLVAALSAEDAELRSAVWELAHAAGTVGMGPRRG
ncbi:hypothetical protein JCM10450v2_004747 [Rhodotorula kratochvilovae]